MKPSISFTPPDLGLLKKIYSFAKNRRIKLFLVGGVLRDILLSREKVNPDFDFCLKKGAINFGRKLAMELRAGFVVLDKEHGACRLVKRIGDRSYTLDFTDFRGKDLAEDVLHRDFTINTLTLDLALLFESAVSALPVDTCCALEDIKNKIIRVADKSSFRDDPLRILRAYSFASMLGFKIDKETLRQAKKYRMKLKGVSGERVRDEMFKLFERSRCADFLGELDKLKILEVIFPEIVKMRGIGKGAYHHLDVWGHTLETVRQLEGVFEEKKGDPGIREYLDSVLSSERKRRAILKFGAFLHDVGKPKSLRREDGRIKFHGHERIGLDFTEKICRRLKLANDEIYALRKMVLWHLRPGYLADEEQPTARAKFRYFRDTGSEAVGILLLSLADQRATLGPLTTRKARSLHEKVIALLLREHFKKANQKAPEKLLNGFVLMKEFKLEPSPLVGKVLREIEELQAIGKIKTKPDALSAAKEYLRKVGS